MMLRKIIPILVSGIIATASFAFPVQATETYPMEKIETIQTEEHPEIELYGTFEGNGGITTLDYLDDDRAIYWTVRPNTILPYSFLGEIHIYTILGKYIDFLSCGGEGIGELYGKEDVSWLQLANGHYEAVFVGTATDALGTQFRVKDDSKIVFHYYRR